MAQRNTENRKVCACLFRFFWRQLELRSNRFAGPLLLLGQANKAEQQRLKSISRYMIDHFCLFSFSCD